MNIFEEIQNKLSIVDVVSKVLTLKKKGAEFIAKCPFHNEKSDSFFVNNTKGLFFCFGCKEKGNMFHFVSKYHNIPIFDAAKKIAEQFNISIEINTPIQQASLNIKDAITKVYSFFLYHANHVEYQKFIQNRGLKTSLGYAPENVSLFDYAKKHFLNIDHLKEIGVLSANNLNIFNNRVIFPIINVQNQIIGFGGRAINNTIMPKYLNSKESVLFHKKYVLYGENIALKQNHDFVFIVEGYVDCLKMHQANFLNTVAVLGTSLTIFHLDKLWKYTKEIVIFFDGDFAGQKALKKTLELAIPYLEMGFKEISAIILKDNLDPDEFLNKYNAKNLYEHKIFIEEILWKLFIDTSSNLELSRSQTVLEKLLSKMQSFSLRQKIFKYIQNKIIQLNKFQNKSIKDLMTSSYEYNYVDLNILIILGLSKYNQFIAPETIKKVLSSLTFEKDFFNSLKKNITDQKIIDFLQQEAAKILDIQNLNNTRQILLYLKIMLIKKDLQNKQLSYANKKILQEKLKTLLAEFDL